MKTLIVSDLHLGSRNSQALAFSRFLHSRFDRLILNGDTVNNLNLKKLRPEHWKVISELRKTAQERELILIRGNHDYKKADDNPFGPQDVLATLLGVPFHEEYQLDVGFRRYLVLHGDRFDPTLSWPLITDAADACYNSVQKVNKKAAKWLKRKAKTLGGVVEFVKQRSVQYCAEPRTVQESSPVTRTMPRMSGSRTFIT